MAPPRVQKTKPTNRKRITSPDPLATSEPSCEAAMRDSQASDDITIMLEKALNETRNKRSSRTKALHWQYSNRVKQMTQKIDTIFAQHEKDAKKLRTSQATSLAALLRRKMEIEQKMRNTLSILKKAYDQGAKEVLAIAQPRLLELKEIEQDDMIAERSGWVKT